MKIEIIPNLNDYKSIKTYEDACDALGEKVDEVALTNAGVPNHIIALMKLELICKTLWGGNFKEVNKYTAYYFPLFRFFTKEDAKYMDNEEMCAILPVHVGYNRAIVSWGYSGVDFHFARLNAYSGFRLCLDTYEKAKYFGRQFLDLWSEYFAYDFIIKRILI